jgi:hypothetical protein
MFFAWITGLADVVAASAPLPQPGPLASKIFIAIIKIVVGVAGLVLLFSAAAGAAPTNNTPPTIQGVFASGQTLTAVTSPSDWSYTGSISFAYQWNDCPGYAATVNSASANGGNSPVGYWRLGEAANATKALDASGNAADGNVGGSVTFGQPGVFASQTHVTDPDFAASFDGSTGFVEVPNASALNPATAFTVEAWVKTTSAQGGTVVAKPFTVGDKQSYSLGVSSAHKAYATVVTTSGTYTATSTTTVNDGNWYLLDATFSGTSLKVYVTPTSGTQTVATATTAGTLQYSALPLELGRFDATKGAYLTGTIDEDSVYGGSAALTATQITAHRTVAVTPLSGSGCGAISAAPTTSIYALPDSELDKQVYVKVTATDGSGQQTASSLSSVVLPGSGPLPSAPVNTVLPDISGTAAVGETLTATNGVWSGAPTGYAYQWERCQSGTCTNISSATAQSYTVQTADQGYALAVIDTATNANGSTAATSAQTATVPTGPTAPVNSVLPVVSGLAEKNQTLTATTGT